MTVGSFHCALVSAKRRLCTRTSVWVQLVWQRPICSTPPPLPPPPPSPPATRVTTRPSECKWAAAHVRTHDTINARLRETFISNIRAMAISMIVHIHLIKCNYITSLSEWGGIFWCVFWCLPTLENHPEWGRDTNFSLNKMPVIQKIELFIHPINTRSEHFDIWTPKIHILKTTKQQQLTTI